MFDFYPGFPLVSILNCPFNCDLMFFSVPFLNSIVSAAVVGRCHAEGHVREWRPCAHLATGKQGKAREQINVQI